MRPGYRTTEHPFAPSQSEHERPGFRVILCPESGNRITANPGARSDAQFTTEILVTTTRLALEPVARRDEPVQAIVALLHVGHDL